MIVNNKLKKKMGELTFQDLLISAFCEMMLLRSTHRAEKQHLETFQAMLPGIQGHNLAMTVLHVPHSLDSGPEIEWYSSQFKNNWSAEMWSGSEEGSYSRLTDCCITQL